MLGLLRYDNHPPLFYLLLQVAMGAVRLPGRASAWAALGALALLDATTFRVVYTQTLNAPMRQVTNDLRYALLPGDLIITSVPWTGSAVRYLRSARDPERHL